MPQQTKTIFLSSTKEDLKEYRKVVIEAIDAMDGCKCVCMEKFGARSWHAKKVCLTKAAESDLLVGILGHRYGSCPDGSQQSFTECEYDAAKKAGRDCLIFLSPDDFGVPANLLETRTLQVRQRAFRKRVAKENTTETFGTPDDLARRVTLAIRHWEQSMPSLGIAPPASISTHAKPHIEHPYLVPSHWIGRQTEMGILDSWLQDGPRSVCCMVAMGGMGKSSLAWMWLKERVEPNQEAFALEGVFQWSFYEGEVSFERFTEGLSAYLGVPPARDRVTEITEHLRSHCVLLILDGFERLLRHYASVDAALLPERGSEELESHERQCADRVVVRFLTNLAANSVAKAILATRLAPEELDAKAACFMMRLDGLSPQDAVTYLRANGIKGLDGELEQTARDYDFHPLSLERLVNVLHYDMEQPDDIRQAPHYETALGLAHRQAHILAQAYDTLPRSIAKFLSVLAAVRGRAHLDTILFLAKNRPGLHLPTALRRLEQDGWIAWDRQANTTGFHPVIRRYAYERLAGKTGLHQRLSRYYLAQIPNAQTALGETASKKWPHPATLVPPVQPGGFGGLGGVNEAIELYYHTARAARYDDACNLYYGLIHAQLYHEGGLYQACTELLSELFVDGWKRPPRLTNVHDQSWVVTAFAVAQSLLGRSRASVPLFELQIEAAQAAGNTEDEGLARGVLSEDLCALGYLARARGNLHEALRMLLRRDDTGAYVRRELGEILMNLGRFGASRRMLEAARVQFARAGAAQPQCVLWAHNARLCLLIGDAPAALKAARRSSDLANSVGNQRNLVWASWVLGRCLTALAAEDPGDGRAHLDEAGTHLTGALTRCRRTNLVELEPDILLAWAHWHRLRGGDVEARTFGEEALFIANRCEYRLNQADIHNFMANSFLHDDAEAAVMHATTAYERAWCDGPPYCYRPALDEAARTLDCLGETIPSLLPYSPT